MKIVFMGTPDFAAGALEALLKAGHEIIAVVTQPDKAKGRSKELQFPPVKQCALAHNIPVMQPEKIKTPEAIAELRKYEAEIFVVAAFGQIVSQEILDMPKYGCLNIHASLLPKYRGASPIQHAIIDGEEQTGITIQQMNAGIDTGDILYTKSIAIEPTDTYETLHDKLTVLGGESIVEALELLESGALVGQKQDDALSSYVRMIQKDMGRLDFSKKAIELERLIRGLNPWPSAFAFYKGKQMKIWEASVEDTRSDAEPGTIVEVDKNTFKIACKEGMLCVLSLQLEGKKRMSTHDFLLGVKVQVGDVLTTQ